MTERQCILNETAAARDKAEALLRSLLDAKSRSERQMAEMGQLDTFKRVTGRSSLDNAIASAQRMIDTLTRSLAEMRRELTDADLALISETARPAVLV